MNIAAVYQDLAAIRVIETHQQVDDGCLAAAGRTDDAQALAMAKSKGDMGEAGIPSRLPRYVRYKKRSRRGTQYENTLVYCGSSRIG